MINLYVGPPVNDAQLLTLRKVEGVAGMEGFSNTTIEWRLSPEKKWTAGGADGAHRLR